MTLTELLFSISEALNMYTYALTTWYVLMPRGSRGCKFVISYLFSMVHL